VIGAVQRDHAASDDRALHAELADDRTVAVISAQLGRPARGRPAVVHACGHGLPTVVRVDPRLEDGTPFPTTFWLACPLLRSAVGRLEAGGEMVQLNERLAAEPDLQAEYELTAQRYVALRDRLGEPGGAARGCADGRRDAAPREVPARPPRAPPRDRGQPGRCLRRGRAPPDVLPGAVRRRRGGGRHTSRWRGASG
jgi:hypothetical protein